MPTGNIILDVATDFNHQLPKEERWQQLAEHRLLEALRANANSAQAYRNKRSNDPGFTQALHDAIFVAAPRGAGKSIFLSNAQSAWKELQVTEPSVPKLHFCGEIDPTLLVNNDNFANVVIAQFYNAVENKLQHGNHPIATSDYFYQKLTQLADALGQSEYKGEELSGIDRIISYRSGIQLESHFHAFVEQCITILDVDAIVLPIDDVDMALNRAFDMLDVVRRLLGCPYIIPLVSGDKALYQPIIHSHFIYGGDPNKAHKLLNEDHAASLTDAYLTKLFPVALRVGLLSLDDILPKLVIRDREQKVPAREYFVRFEHAACPLVNGQENSRNWPKPQTPREMGQLCKQFQPHHLDALDKAKNEKFWYAFQTLAEARYHGAAYLTAKAEQRLIAMRRTAQPEFPARDLEVFNLLKQARATESDWKEKDYYNELNSMAPYNPDKDIVMDEFLGELKTRKYVLKSMPPIEFYIAELSVTKANLDLADLPENSEEKNRAGILLDLYTHRAYYDTALRSGAQIFFGRAFEILLTSLLLSKPTSGGEQRENYWQYVLAMLVTTPPFHSMHAIAPTKTLISSTDMGEDEAPASPTYQLAHCAYMAALIVGWETRFSNILFAAQGQGLVTLLSCVFNKVFTQLHLMRTRTENIFRNDSLTHTTKRFEYIVINAFATFLKPGPVVQQNIAYTTNLRTIEDSKEFSYRDPSFRDNVVGYIGERNLAPVEEHELSEPATLNAALLRAIWAHPLFDLNEGAPQFRLGSRLAPEQSSAGDNISSGEVHNGGSGVNRGTQPVAQTPADKKLQKQHVRQQVLNLIPKNSTIEKLSRDEAKAQLTKLLSNCHRLGFHADDLFAHGSGAGSNSYRNLKRKANGV